MKKYLIISAVILFVPFIRAGNDNCVSCHTDLGDKPSELFKNDVHAAAGLSCQDCHGGNKSSDDMEVSMSKSAGFKGVPSGDEISEICASCHSDETKMKNLGSKIKTGQLEALQTSVHNKISVNGKERILQCTTCHNAHGIKRVNDSSSPVYSTKLPLTCSKCHGDAEYMKSYNPGLPVDQLTKYRTSVHGKLNAKGNAKAADCSSCHGAHNIFSSGDVRSMVYKLNIPSTCSSCHSDKEYMKEFSIATNQYESFRNSVHGKAIFEKDDLAAPVCNDCHGNHGAMPPGITSISNVCGSCHALNASLFSGSPHKKAFEINKYPECETCHGSHEILTARDKLLGVKEDAVCLKCHSESENPKGYLSAGRMSSTMDTLVSAYQHADSLIQAAEQKGMEVEDAKFMLREIHQARLEARTIIHSFDEGKFNEVTDKGIRTAGYVITDAGEAIHEFYFRRYGLGAAIIIITSLIVMIYYYLRKIEKRK